MQALENSLNTATEVLKEYLAFGAISRELIEQTAAEFSVDPTELRLKFFENLRQKPKTEV